MGGQAGTLETIAAQLGLILQPLEDRLASGNVLLLFAELGLRFPNDVLKPSFTNALQTGATAAGKLPAMVTQLITDIENDDEDQIIQDGSTLLGQVATVVTAIEQIATELKNLANSNLPGVTPAQVTAFAQNLATNLIGYLIVSYLETIDPSIVGVANLLGLVSYTFNPGVPGDSSQPPYIQRQLQLSNIGKILGSPADFFQIVYGWGDANFDGTKLFPILGTSLKLFGIDSPITTPTAGNAFQTGLLSLKANGATNPPGLIASLSYPLQSGLNLTIPLSQSWSGTIQMQGAFVAGLQATLTPPASITFKPPTGTLNASIQVDITAQGADAAHPLILLGQTGGSRLQADSFTFGIGMAVKWNSASAQANVEPQVQVQVKQGKAVIDFSGGDGFIASVLSGIQGEADFELTVTWQPDTGIHITGGAQLEIDLPLHLELGPVEVSTLYLVSGITSTGIPIEISVALGLTLGPVSAAVDRIGVTGALTFPNQGGNLGPADLQFAFKPPNGLGLSVDAGPVAGGGYISFDNVKKEYAGFLDVCIAEIVQVKFIAILDTLMPDGSQGFSFIFIIFLELPPIQLGYGFTLNGVGGVAGVNRTMSIPGLQAGLHNHTLDYVINPPHTVADAPLVITAINSFFPVAVGRYLFGPIVAIGWETFVQVTVGVLLEVPDPIRLALLGIIDVALPTIEEPDDAVVRLHIDVLGTLDFGTKKLTVDGSMYGSQILEFPILGDFALRSSWGSNPSSLFSMGGFNPHFNTTGLDVPQLHRLSISIGDGDNPQISANTYLALTSNTIQFGADIEAYLSQGGLTVHGYLGFDVLVVIAPPTISFEFDFSASFDVSYSGVNLVGLTVTGTFTGTTPWHIHGDATLHILFGSVSKSVDKTWGDSIAPQPPPEAILPDLLPALADPQNWNAVLPDGMTQAATLNTAKSDPSIVIVHPMGTLSVREKVVPLDLPISHYKSGIPSDGNYFSIGDVRIHGTQVSKSTFTDFFAAGQFIDLSDADKLSRSSFEPYDAGATIASANICSGQDSARSVQYNEYYLDDPAVSLRLSSVYVMPAYVADGLYYQSTGFQSALKNTGFNKYKNGPSTPVAITKDPSYVVASVEDLSVREDLSGAVEMTYYQAREVLIAHLEKNPDDAGNLQIVPAQEAAS